MGGHQCVDLFLNRPAKADQLHPFDFFQRLVHHGQPQMTVRFRVAMAGEMLAAGDHARLPQAAGISRAEVRYLLRVAAEGAHADDRVFRVGVAVQNGRAVEIHAHGPKLLTDHAAHAKSIFRVAGGTLRHSTGRNRTQLAQTGHRAAFFIQQDHGRQTRLHADQAVQEHAQLPQLLRALNIAAEQDHIADLAVPDQFLKGFGNRVALKARYQTLTRQQLHSFIDHRIFSLLRPL